MSKTIKLVIIFSVVLNILLIGFIIGNLSHRFFINNSVREKPQEISVKLPPDKKELFFNTMQKVRAENRTARKQIRETRRKIFSILTSPQFDEDSYESEAEKLHLLRGLMMKRFSNATKDLAKQLNHEERMALAEHLRRPPRHHREKIHPDTFRDPPYRRIPPGKPVP